MYGRRDPLQNPLQRQSQLQARGYGPLKSGPLSVAPMGWWDKYLPSIIGVAAGGAAQSLNLLLPGAGTIAAPIAHQGAKLGTQAAMGQDVGKKELVEAGTAAGTGAMSAGVGVGLDKYSESLEQARQAEALSAAQADADFNVNLTDLQKRANVTSAMPTAEADHRAGLLAMQDRLQAASGGREVTQAGADQVFSPGVASQRVTGRQREMLRQMNPGINLPEQSSLPVPSYETNFRTPGTQQTTRLSPPMYDVDPYGRPYRSPGQGYGNY
jgi:hypothetical protein